MTGSALVCLLASHQKIDGADFIVQVDMFGDTIITSLDNLPGTLGLLFDCETELSHDFISDHNLYRHSELNADKEVSGLFEDSRRIRPIKLRGVKCSGFFMPMKNLSPKWVDNSLTIGQQINSIKGRDLCKKWVNPKNLRKGLSNKAGRAAKKNLAPTFIEHFDTDQLERNWEKIVCDSVVLTRKLHGTSCRAGLLPIIQEDTKLQKILSYIGIKPKNKTKYGLVVGSRRVTKYIENSESRNTDKHKKSYYNHNIWVDSAIKNFSGKLNKGEVVYYEIVGYLPSGEAIMPGRSTSSLKKFLDKKEYEAWVARYSDNISFSYGCSPNEYSIYVYRITSVNEDGVSIDYTWEQVKARCGQMGVNHVPELCKIHPHVTVRNDPKAFQYFIEKEIKFHNGFCDIFKGTPNEGVVLRQESPTFIPTVLKSKTFEFKVLEGIIKESSIDIEESN